MPLARPPLPSRLTKEYFERDLHVSVPSALGGLLRQAEFVAKRKPSAEGQQEFEALIMDRVQQVARAMPTFDWSLLNLDTLTGRTNVVQECTNLVSAQHRAAAARAANPVMPPNFAGSSAGPSPTGSGGDRATWIRESAIARTALIDDAFRLAGVQHRELIQRAIAQLDAQVSVLQFSYKGRTVADIFAKAGLRVPDNGAPSLPPPAQHHPVRLPAPHQALIPNTPLPPSQYLPLPGSVSIVQQQGYNRQQPPTAVYNPPPQPRVIVPPPIVSAPKNPHVRDVLIPGSHGSTSVPNRKATGADDGLLEDYFGRGKRGRSPPSSGRSPTSSGHLYSTHGAAAGGLGGDLRAALMGRRSEKSTISGFLVGKCRDMERRYSRETPTAHDIRPRAILEKAFAFVVNKSKTHPDFVNAPNEGKVYLSHQLKGMRQDLKVQNLTDPFSVSVYEFHAKLAIDMNETMELVQCQTALKHFYSKGHFGKDGAITAEEFTCYRLLYLACAGESRLTDEVTTLQLASKGMVEEDEEQQTGAASSNAPSAAPSVVASEDEFSDDDFAPAGVFPKTDVCSAYSWFGCGNSTSTSTQIAEVEKMLKPQTATDCLFYHEKTKRTMQLCGAIMANDSLEFSRLMSLVDPSSSEQQDSLWWPMTKELLSHYMQKIRLNWLSRFLNAFKGQLSMRFLMRALAFVPHVESSSATEIESENKKKTKKGSKQENVGAGAAGAVSLAGPQWMDKSAAQAEDELFSLFQLLKLMQPPKFNFHREVQPAIQQQFGGPTIDATELKTAVTQHLTELNTRRDF